MISYTANDIIEDAKKLAELVQKCCFHERKNVGSLKRPGNLSKLTTEDIWEIGAYLGELQAIKQRKVYYTIEDSDVVIERINECEINKEETKNESEE